MPYTVFASIKLEIWFTCSLGPVTEQSLLGVGRDRSSWKQVFSEEYCLSSSGIGMLIQ
jgi:hypothetical protein